MIPKVKARDGWDQAKFCNKGFFPKSPNYSRSHLYRRGKCFIPLIKGGHRVMVSGFLQRVQETLHHQEQFPNKHV